MTSSTLRKNSYFQIAAIIILGFVIYANSLNGKLVWDDYSLVKKNSYIKDWHNIPKIFTQDIGSGSGSSSDFYRPLQIISYMVDYSLWGLNVRGYHFTNILLHILTALAIYWFISGISNNKTISFITSLLFVAHPIHTEAVSYISGRADSLSLLFMLLSLVYYIKFHISNNIKFHILAALSFIFALFSKESSVILPFLILFYHYVFKKKLKSIIFFPILGITLGYIFLRSVVFKYQLVDISFPASLLERIPGFFVAITKYLRLLLLPFDLHMEYGNKLFKIIDIRAMLGLLISLLLITFAFLKRKNNALIFFSIGWFFITLLPVTNIYIINASYIMEHWLYVPSLGFFLILAGTVCYPLKNKTLVFLLRVSAAFIIIFYSLLTIRQNEYWRDPVTFYKRTLQYAPDSWRFYNELGIEYANMRNDSEAESAYRQALRINPDAAGIYFNLGALYSRIGNKEKSAAMYKRAEEINAKSVLYYYGLGDKYKNAGKYKKAMASYNKALEFDPDNPAVCSELGSTYIFAGKYKEAIALFKKALEIKPDFALAHNNLALAYYYDKQYNLAILHCDKAIELGYKVDSELLDWLRPYRKQK